MVMDMMCMGGKVTSVTGEKRYRRMTVGGSAVTALAQGRAV